MEWADPHPWQVTRRRRPRRRFEAALVGLAMALVYLILEPASLDRARHQIAEALIAWTGLPPPAAQG